jgi:hypothetical protein
MVRVPPIDPPAEKIVAARQAEPDQHSRAITNLKLRIAIWGIIIGRLSGALTSLIFDMVVGHPIK